MDLDGLYNLAWAEYERDHSIYGVVVAVVCAMADEIQTLDELWRFADYVATKQTDAGPAPSAADDDGGER